MEKEDKEKMIQSLTITFSDGTTGNFTGPAALLEGEVKIVSEIQFHPPRTLPSDCHWSQI
jgi:hypothetical protein